MVSKYKMEKIDYNTFKKTAMNTSCFYIIKGNHLYKPINSNVAKPCEKWKLSQSNKEQEIVVLARIITPHLCKEDSLHGLHQEDSHA